MSPVFDLVKRETFADHNINIKFNLKVNDLIVNLEMKLEMILKWLKGSGLKVNELNFTFIIKMTPDG